MIPEDKFMSGEVDTHSFRAGEGMGNFHGWANSVVGRLTQPREWTRWALQKGRSH